MQGFSAFIVQDLCTIPCQIHGWCDKSERFMIEYYDELENRIVKCYKPYDSVYGWSWEALKEFFFSDN